VERQIRTLLVIIVVAVTIVLFPNDWEQILFESCPPTNGVTVTDVVDGDTIKLSDGTTIRYIGIDTPETKHPHKGVECFGLQASKKNSELVLGKTVKLTYDVSKTDRYGRVLAYVWVEGKMVNETLVKEGYAFATAFPPDVLYQDTFEMLEAEAKFENRGLWNECE